MKKAASSTWRQQARSRLNNRFVVLGSLLTGFRWDVPAAALHACFLHALRITAAITAPRSTAGLDYGSLDGWDKGRAALVPICSVHPWIWLPPHASAPPFFHHHRLHWFLCIRPSAPGTGRSFVLTTLICSFCCSVTPAAATFCTMPVSAPCRLHLRRFPLHRTAWVLWFSRGSRLLCHCTVCWFTRRLPLHVFTFYRLGSFGSGL